MDENLTPVECEREHYPYTWARAARTLFLVAGVCFIIWVLMGHG